MKVNTCNEVIILMKATAMLTTWTIIRQHVLMWAH